jgi:hypothetical protein
MAWRSDSVYELRPDGASSNGMGFSTALGGTDYSQQTAPQISVTDGVTNGTTTVTSASANFTVAIVGNGINIAGDSLYQILSVGSTTSITVDRATANGGAGRTMKVGGAGTIQNAAGGFDPEVYGVFASGMKMWVRRTNAAGVLTPYNKTPGGTPGLTVTGSQVNPVTTEGYGAVRGDGGFAVLNFPGWPFNISGSFNIARNLQISTVSGTQETVVVSGSQCHLENIICDPGTSNSPSLANGGNNNVLRRVWAKGPSSAGGGNPSGDLSGTANLYEYCEFSGSVAHEGVRLNTDATFLGCIFRDNFLDGVQQNNLPGVTSQFKGCIFWNNGRDGLRLVNGVTGVMDVFVEGCIFGMNAGYDLDYTPADISANTGAIEWAKNQLRCNEFFTTGLGRYHNLPAGADDLTLGVNPFISSATGNFMLNTLSTGGSLVSGSVCITTFADGLNTANSIAGFYGVTPAPPPPTDVVTMRNLWRELTNERNLIVVPDSVVDIYLDFGIQEFYRRTHFFYVTDSTDVTLVVGQQEYPMPTDAVEIVWVQYGSNRLLEKGSVEQWRRLGEDWRNEPEGEPRFWSHYGGNNFVIRPAPSALAVAAAPNLTIRRKSTPPSVTTNGLSGLPSLYLRPVVMYGAALWSAAYPDSVVAQQRAAFLKAEFDADATNAQEDFARREISL